MLQLFGEFAWPCSNSISDAVLFPPMHSFSFVPFLSALWVQSFTAVPAPSGTPTQSPNSLGSINEQESSRMWEALGSSFWSCPPLSSWPWTRSFHFSNPQGLRLNRELIRSILQGFMRSDKGFLQDGGVCLAHEGLDKCCFSVRTPAEAHWRDVREKFKTTAPCALGLDETTGN